MVYFGRQLRYGVLMGFCSLLIPPFCIQLRSWCSIIYLSMFRAHMSSTQWLWRNWLSIKHRNTYCLVVSVLSFCGSARYIHLWTRNYPACVIGNGLNFVLAFDLFHFLQSITHPFLLWYCSCEMTQRTWPDSEIHWFKSICTCRWCGIKVNETATKR